jgi:heptosyltransferase-3
MELQNIRRIGVFKTRNIGDVLMITPALRALRETFPEARITAIVNSGTELILAHNPHIDDLVVYPRTPEGSTLGLFARARKELHFLRELRRRCFDLTIGFTDGDRAAWSSYFSGARYRVGALHYTAGKYDLRQRLYNVRIPSSLPPMHEVEKHLHILKLAGIKLRAQKPGKLSLVVPVALREWAWKELEPLRGRPIVHVHPVARWLWKCWRNESMAEVIDWLQTERDGRVVMTTGPVARERERAQEVLRLCRTRPLFYDGNLSLTQIAAISAESDVYFGVDTAPMHMAAAVGIPVIALFGPTVPEVWGPWTERKIILSHPCACNVTKTQACDWSEVRACLAAITPAEAKEALDRMLFASKSATS